MIPLRDDQPIFSTPFVNYFLIVLNIVIFLWGWSMGLQNPHALNSFLDQFSVNPQHTMAVLSGHSPDGFASVIVPLFTSMFLHTSFLHVGGNMLFLWIFGDNIAQPIVNGPHTRCERCHCRGDGSVLHSLSQSASPHLVSANIFLSCSRLAHARILVRRKFPERYGHGNRRNQSDFGRNRALGTHRRIRRRSRND
jgi:hypothetical protein